MARESDVLLLVCSGFLSGAPGWPPYSFLGCTDDLPVNRVYVRDVQKAWYHLGLNGISGNIDGTADFLRGLIAEHGVRKTVVAGVSAGGYLALLLGPMIEANEVITICPRTFLDPANRAMHHDNRLSVFVERLYASGRAQEEYFDAREVLASRAPRPKGSHLYYGRHQPIDRAHAEHVSGLPGVVLHPVEFGGHEVAHYLVKSGFFRARLERSLGLAADG